MTTVGMLALATLLALGAVALWYAAMRLHWWWHHDRKPRR